MRGKLQKEKSNDLRPVLFILSKNKKVMKIPTPKTVLDVLNDSRTKFKVVECLKPKGKRGPTFKGLHTQVKKLAVGSQERRKLEKQLFKMTFYKCEMCHKVFLYESERNQHYKRSYQDRRHYTRLHTMFTGYFCKVCGYSGKEWRDGRGLKKHYLDRKQHSAREVLDAGVRLWSYKEITDDDKVEVRDWLEDRGIIVEEGASSSSDEDYVEE